MLITNKKGKEIFEIERERERDTDTESANHVNIQKSKCNIGNDKTSVQSPVSGEFNFIDFRLSIWNK